MTLTDSRQSFEAASVGTIPTAKRFYRAYGRNLESNVEIPGFQEIEPTISDLAVTWSDLPSPAIGLDNSEAVYRSHYHPPEGGERPFSLFRLEASYVASWHELCDFEVSGDGMRIVCYPAAGVSWGDANPFIQGRILPLALNFRGAVTLHGAAVSVDGGVAALLGTSGTGKSTLSARFHSLGHTLVADDLVAVWQDGGTPTVEWGPNHVRLDDRSMQFVRQKIHDPLQAELDYDKTRVTLRPDQADIAAGLPLRTIYMLERVAEGELEGPEIVEVPPLTALPTIVQGISNRTILGKDRMAEQFKLIMSMLNDVPVKHLRYPSGMELLAGVCELVNADR